MTLRLLAAFLCAVKHCGVCFTLEGPFYVNLGECISNLHFCSYIKKTLGPGFPKLKAPTLPNEFPNSAEEVVNCHQLEWELESCCVCRFTFIDGIQLYRQFQNEQLLGLLFGVLFSGILKNDIKYSIWWRFSTKYQSKPKPALLH